MDVKLLTIMLCFLLGISDSIMFRKFMTLNDSDNAILFTPLANPAPKMRKSLVECGAYARYTLTQPNKAMRASAFQYVNQVCTLGRTPMFDDRVEAKPTVTDGSDGTHAVVGMKPTAPTDMVAYFVFNEVCNLRYPATPGLTGVTQSSSPPGTWSLPSTSFTMTSPVQTLEGQFAAPAFPNIAYLHDPKNYTNLSVMLWYNSGPSPSSSIDSLFGTFNEYPSISPSTISYVFLGGGTGGKLQFKYLTPCAAMQSNTTVNVVMPTNNWVYIGFTYQPGTIILYVNGTQQAQYSLTACGPNPGVLTNMVATEIGYDSGSSMAGYMASFEIYDRFLSQSEVFDAMQKSTISRTLKT